MAQSSCWEWHIDPQCNEWMLFGDCPECGDITSAVMPSGDFVGMVTMSCQRVNDVAKSVPDGCGWLCQVYVDVPKRKVFSEVCSIVSEG
ncbi:unnamed protein product [marine sediment metagenome]|uniref:Uncharacterized protein n=1 Tax=marine sediment metagenome TaxID=412755 RepID=X1S150_9ZZZZ